MYQEISSRGIGSKLLDSVERYAQVCNIKSDYGYNKNGAAQALYSKRGWKGHEVSESANESLT